MSGKRLPSFLSTVTKIVACLIVVQAGGAASAASWSNQDIGAVGAAGSASLSTGAWTVKGAGADIWGTSDAFQFVSQPLTGNGQIIARVVSEQNTNVFAKAGVMIRDGATAGAAHVLFDIKPGGGTELMQRSTAGGTTSFITGTSVSFPYWIKLVRQGSTITAYQSSDGSTWALVGSTTATMSATVSYGLVVCSHDITTLNTSTFDHVSVAPIAATSLNLLTWNLEIGNQDSDTTIQQEMDNIAGVSPLPDVVIIQEAKLDPWDRNVYASRLTADTGKTWTEAVFQVHCQAFSGQTCTQTSLEGVGIITTLPLAPTNPTETRFFPYADCWHAGRGVTRAAVVKDGVTVQVFSLHLPTDAPNGACTGSKSAQREASVGDLKTWVSTLSGPFLVGGDMNGDRTSPEIEDTSVGMASRFADAWLIVGSGAGLTWPASGPSKVDDYWFAEIGGEAVPRSAAIPTFVTNYSDHLALQTSYDIYTSAAPLGAQPAVLPGRVEAEDFDNGGESLAYHDTSLLNLGGQFRIDQSVDIESATDLDGVYDVGWVDQGEWLAYTVNVTNAGTYTFSARIASPCTGGAFHVEVNGASVTGSVPVPNTGGWQTYQTVTASGVTLTPGTSAVKIVADTSGGGCGISGVAVLNINWFSFTQP